MDDHIPAFRAMMNISLLGHNSTPRGEGIREVLWYRDLIEYPFHSFESRPRDNLDYIKREFQWYLHANKFDTRICKHASIWSTIVQPTGEIFSNYGQYWFSLQNGFKYVIKTLKEDKDSRRAYIPMCAKEHMFVDNSDMVCTKGITFRIVREEVQMHVDMRSSDLFIGASIDWPCFTFFHEMVACALNRPVGDFVFSADSLHVYTKNWHHVRKILDAYGHDTYEVEYPEITDPGDLMGGHFKSPFGQWLTEVRL